MSKHKHAELMVQYAQDAMETDTPWRRWEHFNKGCWHEVVGNPFWHDHQQYRRKPKTSRARFEAWWFHQYWEEADLHREFGWKAWQEAERQAKASGDAAGGE